MVASFNTRTNRCKPRPPFKAGGLLWHWCHFETSGLPLSRCSAVIVMTVGPRRCLIRPPQSIEGRFDFCPEFGQPLDLLRRLLVIAAL